jgi:hypothetical protein
VPLNPKEPGKQSEPVDPLSAMASSAVQMHEVYLALQVGGFSKMEALYLLAQMVLGKQ